MSKFLKTCELCEKTLATVAGFGQESEYTVRSMDGKWIVMLWIDADFFVRNAATIVDFVRGTFGIQNPEFDERDDFCRLTIYEEK